MTALIKVC